MKISIVILAVGICSISSADAQLRPSTFRLSAVNSDSISTSSQPLSNSVYPIVVSNGTVYLATVNGLNFTTNGGATFQSFQGATSPADSSISSVAIEGDTIAAAVAAPQIDLSGSPTDVGGGLYVSTDNGATWTYTKQSQDDSTDTTIVFGKSTLKALPIQTSVQNISYSLAFFQGYLYSANWGGGLRRTSDLGRTWHRVVLPPDNLSYINQDSVYTFELSVQANTVYNTTEANLNQEPFFVYSDGDSVLYVGTANGINKTTDNGASWYKFNHQNDPGMSGDWVLWIAADNYNGNHYIWAVTRNAVDPTEVSALSYTMNGGSTWQNIFDGHNFHSVAVDGKTAYGASDDGLFRTSNFGISSQVITNIYDQATGQSNLSQVFNAVAVQGDTVWVGTNDGVAAGIDNGYGLLQNDWNVFRTYVSVSKPSSTYFYPNPFSPRLDVGRIHYLVNTSGSTVTIRIFDFSMHPVRTLIQNVPQNAGQQDVPWNGLDDSGQMVDNGVYFYSVVVNSQAPAWGKILVIR